jgi:hypothetical protein
MAKATWLRVGVPVAILAVAGAVSYKVWLDKSPPRVTTGPVTVHADEIGGVVSGAKGPEAGVWVIAETSDLPTKYTKIVVTDDQGR